MATTSQRRGTRVVATIPYGRDTRHQGPDSDTAGKVGAGADGERGVRLPAACACSAACWRLRSQSQSPALPWSASPLQ